jgi:hypothetical protein
VPDFDRSRQADLANLQRKMNDPNVPDYEKKRIDDAIHAIKDQASFKSIGQMREKLFAAAQNGDKAEKIAAEGKKIDRDWSNSYS